MGKDLGDLLVLSTKGLFYMNTDMTTGVVEHGPVVDWLTLVCEM